MTNDDDRGGGPSPIRLGALEKQVMGLLWDHEPLTVRQIIELSEAEPAYTTIATVLTNLERKGLVSRELRSVATWCRDTASAVHSRCAVFRCA